MSQKIRGVVRLPFLFFYAGLSGLAVALQSLLVILSPKPERRRALEFFRNGARLRAMRWNGVQDYPVYVINREKDTDRLQVFSRSCQGWGINFQRVEGVDLQKKTQYLAQFSDRIGQLCYNRPDFIRGIYGCFLAHREAWRRVQSGGSEWAFVCEDDARFLGPLPIPLESLGIPGGAEIVFANVRMASGILGRERCVGVRKELEFIPIAQALLELLAVSPNINAPGGDGYFLSKKGAEKLLTIFEEWTMDFDVDWFMLFQCLGAAEMEHFLSVDTTGRFDGYMTHPNRLCGYVMVPSLVEQAGGESKVRRAEFCSREELFC